MMQNANCGLYILKSYICPVFVIRTRPSEHPCLLFEKLYYALPLCDGESEPRMNILCWRQSWNAGREDEIVILIFPRKKHRPACYGQTGEHQLLVSPGALDMGGLLITPREKDFRTLTAGLATDILREVTLSEEELQPVIGQFTRHLKKDGTENTEPRTAPERLHLLGQRQPRKGRANGGMQRRRHPVEWKPIPGTDFYPTGKQSFFLALRRDDRH